MYFQERERENKSISRSGLIGHVFAKIRLFLFCAVGAVLMCVAMSVDCAEKEGEAQKGKQIDILVMRHDSACIGSGLFVEFKDQMFANNTVGCGIELGFDKTFDRALKFFDEDRKEDNSVHKTCSNTWSFVSRLYAFFYLIDKLSFHAGVDIRRMTMRYHLDDGTNYECSYTTLDRLVVSPRAGLLCDMTQNISIGLFVQCSPTAVYNMHRYEPDSSDHVCYVMRSLKIDVVIKVGSKLNAHNNIKIGCCSSVGFSRIDFGKLDVLRLKY